MTMRIALIFLKETAAFRLLSILLKLRKAATIYSSAKIVFITIHNMFFESMKR